jgi:hypothetical protein
LGNRRFKFNTVSNFYGSHLYRQEYDPMTFNAIAPVFTESESEIIVEFGVAQGIAGPGEFDVIAGDGIIIDGVPGSGVDPFSTLLADGSGISTSYNSGTRVWTITNTGGGGGGGGATNLSVSTTSTTVTVASDTGTDATLATASGSVAGIMTAAQFTKISGIATGATANSADATLLARANHTGTQTWSTITSTPTTLSGYGIADAITSAAVAAGYQPLDSDLTAIAALTTTSFGRSLLTQADAAAARTTIGAGTSSFDGAYSSLSGVPSTFTPASHTHAGSQINSGTVYVFADIFDVTGVKANDLVVVTGDRAYIATGPSSFVNLVAEPIAHSHSATAITTGILPVARGGTGTGTIGTPGQIPQVNAGGTALEFITPSGGGNAQTANPLSQFAATTSAQLAGVISDETGTGALVFANSPTLVTPAIGTPASGTLTNCTGLPTAGILDAAVTLAKMANLAQDQFIGRTTASTGVPQTATITAAARTVLDDTTVSAMVDTLGGSASTGTGGLVRATSATLVTPILGTPTSGTLTNCTGLPTTGIVNDAVTYAKIQNVSAASRLLGRGDSGSGDPEEIILGSGLTMTGTTLSASGGGGGGTVLVRTQDFRLTTETGVSVSTSDRTAQSTIYLTPHIGNQIAIYDGSAWQLRSSAEVSLALSGLTSGKNYDVFAYWSGSAVVLELSAAWTNDTTRADAITRQDGVWCKSGALTRRFVGTLRTTGTTTTEDSTKNRFLWNCDNRLNRRLMFLETTSTWTYSSTTYRAVRGDTTSSTRSWVSAVCGLVGCGNLKINANYLCGVAASNFGLFAIGIDGVSTDTANSVGLAFTGGELSRINGVGGPWMIKDHGIGYHFYQALEASYTGGSVVDVYGFFGPGQAQSGLIGEIEC